MPLNAEFLADTPPGSLAATAPAIYGQRAAQILGALMVAALALAASLRWTGDTSSTLETVVQQPLPADATASSPRADLTAPDPGDEPPP